MLHLLTLLAQSADGLRADEVADALRKSTSTAYNLLDTLCQERFVVRGEHGTYRLAAEAAAMIPATRGHDLPAGLAGVLDELFHRTHKRVYLAAAQSGQVVIPLARGRQGMPRIPGLGARIGENAHALALGKVALSLLDEPRLDRYIGRGLRAFTPYTITSPADLREQLAEIRAGAVAYDREEFGEDACCLAMPVHNARGRAVAALGISMSTRCFDVERTALSEALRDVAALASEVLAGPIVPAISEDPEVLESPAPATVRSSFTATPDNVVIGEESSP